MWFSNFIQQAALSSLNQAGLLFISSLSCCNSRACHWIPHWYYTAGWKHQAGYLLTISSFGIGLFHLNQTLYKVIYYSIIAVPIADRTPAFPYVIENKSQIIAQIILVHLWTFFANSSTRMISDVAGSIVMPVSQSEKSKLKHCSIQKSSSILDLQEFSAWSMLTNTPTRQQEGKKHKPHQQFNHCQVL